MYKDYKFTHHKKIKIDRLVLKFMIKKIQSHKLIVSCRSVLISRVFFCYKLSRLTVREFYGHVFETCHLGYKIASSALPYGWRITAVIPRLASFSTLYILYTLLCRIVQLTLRRFAVYAHPPGYGVYTCYLE